MAPTSGRAYDRRWWTLVVLSVSLLVISLDNTILNVALPTIERDLDASAGALQWIVDSYTLVFAGLLLTMGSLGDRFGRRRALVGGLFVFGAGSLLSALAPSADALIASRALMGLGGALIMPSTLSILTNVFPAEERPKAIGIWAAVAGLGIAIGPATGGWLIEQFDWSAVFLVNLPIVVLALAAAPSLVPESRDPKQSRLDPLGAVLSTAGLGVLTWSIIEAAERGWTDGIVLGGFGVALVALAAFVAWELRTASPMLDVRLFRVRRFSGASVSIALVFFSLFGAIYFLTTYLQSVMDYGALDAGLRVTPVALGLVLGGPLSAKLAERLGTRNVVAGGLVVVAAALLMLSGADADSGYGLIAASLVLLGFGMGSTMAPATESIMSSLPLAHAGVGSAMNDTVRMVGGTLGVAVLGSLLSSRYGADMEGAVDGLPEPAAEAARESIGHASVVADRLGGDAGATLERVAETAFSSAMGATTGIGTREAPARGRGRPRSEEAHRAILAAVIELLPEHGLKGLTIEAVAARAGVGKTTIYRHWETRNDLIVEALQQLRPPGPPPDTGSLAGDLEAIVTLQRDRLEASTLPRTMPRVLADASEDPDLLEEIVGTVVLPIRAILEECVERAVARGELREDVDRASLVDVLHSVPVYLLLLNGGDIGALAGVPTRIVAMLTEGVSSSSEGPASARPRSSGSSRATRARSG